MNLRLAAAIAATALVLICFALAAWDVHRKDGPTWVFAATATLGGTVSGYLFRFAFTGTLT